ncbi:MAG: endonuclease [Agarilytica sp.]
MKLIITALLCLFMYNASAQDKIANLREADLIFWQSLYQSGESFYCSHNFEEPRTTTTGEQITLELVYDTHWIVESLGCKRAKFCKTESEIFDHAQGDLHNLWPVLSRARKIRGDRIWGEVDTESAYWPDCSIKRKRAIPIIEVRPEIRGEIARSVFYMAHTYNFFIPSELKPYLAQWSDEDPPSAEEKHRNDTIEKLQGTRNVYIDKHELVHQHTFIWKRWKPQDAYIDKIEEYRKTHKL